MVDFDTVDANNSGAIDKAEWDALRYRFERERLIDENLKRDSQRRMAWFALWGCLLYPLGVILASYLGLSQAASIIGSMAPIYFLAISALVATFFGVTNLSRKGTEK
jgi:hypothetical protein